VHLELTRTVINATNALPDSFVCKHCPITFGEECLVNLCYSGSAAWADCRLYGVSGSPMPLWSAVTVCSGSWELRLCTLHYDLNSCLFCYIPNKYKGALILTKEDVDILMSGSVTYLNSWW